MLQQAAANACGNAALMGFSGRLCRLSCGKCSAASFATRGGAQRVEAAPAGCDDTPPPTGGGILYSCAQQVQGCLDTSHTP